VSEPLIIKTDQAREILFGELDPELPREQRKRLKNQHMEWLRRWLREGKLRGKRNGRDWYIASHELRRFAETMTTNDG